MNVLFAVCFAICCLFCIIFAPDAFLSAITVGGENAVNLSLKLFAIYLFWLGIMEICEGVGFSDKLATSLKPITRKLFGNVDPKCQSLLCLNLSCNLLGIGNVGTLAGIEAMQILEREKMNKAAVLFFVINATSIQVIPTTILSLRQAYLSATPFDILLPSLIVSVSTTVIGFLIVKIFVK